MKRLVMASIAVFVLSFLAFAPADAGSKERKAKVVTSEVNLEAPYSVPQAYAGMSLLKAGASSAIGTIIDSTDYDYGFNSGWTQSLVTYNNAVHITYMNRNTTLASPNNRRSQNYRFSADGTTWGPTVEIQPKSVAASGFGSIDVFRSGAGAGVAVAAGHTPNWFAIDGGPGSGTFTVSPMPRAGNPGDPEILVDNNGNDIWYLDMGGRATITVSRSTDFGQTWAVVGDTDLVANYAGEGFTAGGLDNPMLQGPNGDVIIATTLIGNGAVAPMGTAHADTADGIGYFRYNGSAWTWTSWGDDGDYLVVGPDTLYIFFENFGGVCAVVDNNNDVHMVVNGYMAKIITRDSLGLADSTTNYFTTLYRKSGQSGWSIISRAADMRYDDYDTYAYNGNAFGFAYPGIAFDPAGGTVFALWSQPRVTAGNIDTLVGGFPIYDLWYNNSGNGGTAWGTATKIANTDNGLFAYAGRYLTGGPSAPVAHIVYLEDFVGGNGVFGESAALMVPWRYFSMNVTSVGGQHGVPTGFELNQNYPNPFNPATTINYTLGASEFVTLKVYNMLGQEVATLVNGMEDAGSHTVTFDASKLATGMYLYKMTAGSFSEVKKMVLTK